MARHNQAMEDLLKYNAAILPMKRSAFSKNHSHVTTFDSAYLVPIMWDRVLPGDEKKIRYSGLARMATPVAPTMDEANLDVWAFYCPDRLWWNHAKEFYGENKDASFNPDGKYTMPFLSPSKYFTDVTEVGTLNDYFGFPVIDKSSIETEFEESSSMRVTAGLHRVYQLIYNEYFRNSSVVPALQLNDGDTVNAAEWEVIKQIRKATKYPDYFTTLLREPQAGDDVLLPLGEWAPVVTRSQVVFPNKFTNYSNDNGLVTNIGENYDGIIAGSPLKVASQFYSGTNEWYEDNSGSLSFVPGNSASNVVASESLNSYDGTYPIPVNLWTDLTSASATTINNLRAAITIQQLLEIDAMAGKRYQQILQAHFGVFTPDGTLQRPELLGATRTPVGMRQVLQTSATVDGETPQGNAAAVSVTNVTNEWICNKAFTEPGFLMVIACVRPYHSYSQGIDCLLQKLDRYDHYYPVFDHLGNQPVYSREIYAKVGQDFGIQNVDIVMGYKEAWSEYRIKNNRVSGLMRPDVDGSLSFWNYSSNFANTPLLNKEFVEEDPELMDRTIAVQSEPQFILDSYFEYLDIKNMGVHSIPGLTRL